MNDLMREYLRSRGRESATAVHNKWAQIAELALDDVSGGKAYRRQGNTVVVATPEGNDLSLVPNADGTITMAVAGDTVEHSTWIEAIPGAIEWISS